MKAKQDHGTGVSAKEGAANIRFGWWALVIYLALGAALETFHALKLGWYLDVTNETRRLLFTLGHAHGTLLAIVNVAFGLSAQHASATAGRGLRLASACLRAAAVLMPAGFLAGGLVVHGGDPGLGILLVPPGAVALLIGVVATARSVGR